MNNLFAKIIPLLLFFCEASPSINARAGSSQGDEPGGYSSEPPVTFERLAPELAASGSRVWSILQDRHGFMWFGSTNGLIRYDGQAAVTFVHAAANPHSLSDNFIDTMIEDRTGALWVGTEGGGLNKFDPRTERFRSFLHDPGNPHSLSSNHVGALCEDRSGILWIGTRGGGLNRLVRSVEGNDEAVTFDRYRQDPNNPQSLSHDDVYAIHQDKTGALWIGTYGGGLNKMTLPTDEAGAAKNGIIRPAFIRYRHDPANPNSLSNDNVYSICADPFNSDILWIGTWGGGLNRFNTKTGACRRYQNLPTDEHSLSDDKVARVFVDQSNVLWAGTWGGGLNRLVLGSNVSDQGNDFAASRFARFKSDPFDPCALTHNNVVSIYEDRTGLLWIGTAGGGVSIYDRERKPFRHYRNHPLEPNSLSENDVRSIYEDRDGNLWVGTQGGGLNQFDRGRQRVRRYQHNPANSSSLGDNSVWAIHEDRQGILWLGTFNGLDRFDRRTGKCTHYRHDLGNPGSLNENTVYAICEDRRGFLWIGTEGGLNQFNPQTEDFTHYRHEAGDPHSLSANAVLTIREDSRDDGILWLGTSDGLDRFDRRQQLFIRYQHDPKDSLSLSHNAVYALHQDRAGALWIGTAGGLNKLLTQEEGERPAGSFIHYTRKEGLPSDFIASILEDEEGNLWVGTPEGLAKFNPDTGNCRQYAAHDGLLNSDFSARACFKSPGGEMFFGGPNGLNAFFPATIRDNPYAPPIVLTELQLANQPVAIGGESVLQSALAQTEALRLPYKERVISFEFAALNYRAPHQNRYRYKLEGFDENWIEVDSKNRRATYANLCPGEYTFRVTGSNNDGVWNEEGKALALVVTPPWEQTWWFRISALLSLALSLVSAHLLRTRSIRRRNVELGREIAERQKAEEKFQGLLESAPDAMFIANINGEIVLANTQAEKLFGYLKEELVGKSIEILVPERFRGRHREHRKFYLAEPKVRAMGANLELYGLRKDGSEFPTDINLSPTATSEGMLVIAAVRDITARRHAEEALQQSEERYRGVVEGQTELICRFLPDGTLTFANEAYCRYFQRSEEELVGRSFWPLIPEEARAPAQQHLASITLDHPVRMIEHPVIAPNEETRWQQWTDRGFFDEQGRLLEFQSVGRDITERRRAEEALRTAFDEIAHLKEQLQAENVYLREELKLDSSIEGLTGESAVLKYVLHKVKQVAPTDTTVLILGETGTGKELLARAIHSRSGRSNRPLIKVDCAALPANLIESELFGHERGAFTGALHKQTGRFELADGGTILLDEIGELPLDLQAKLLRVIQDGEFERIGSSRTLKVNVRIIAATNRNLKEEVRHGKFREDLYYRLNVYAITVPPLRERLEDIPILVKFFVQEFSRKLAKKIDTIPQSMLGRMQQYSWPGNVRELKNVIERAVIISSGATLRVEMPEAEEREPHNGRQLEDVERDHILKTLEKTNWRIAGSKGAARLLGLNPSTLRSRIQKLGIKKSNSAP